MIILQLFDEREPVELYKISVWEEKKNKQTEEFSIRTLY